MAVNPLDRVVKKYKARIDGLERRITRIEEQLHSVKNEEASQNDLLDALALIRPFSPDNFQSIRIGSANDGGYVIIDDLATIEAGISCGISTNDDFDLSIAQKNISVLQFDHTIDRAPSSHVNLKFFKEKIVASPNENGRTLASLLNGSRAGSVLLKIDIEGDEWPVFDAVPDRDLDACRQIVCEFHSFDKICEPAFLVRALRVFRKLNQKFFVCHVHGNNYGGISVARGVALPNVLEITFASRRYYTSIDNKPIFPSACDAPNDVSRPDYRIGCFWF